MRHQNVDDRLSSLPEDIVSYILSLMPMVHAVRTCILSKRWRYSWTHVTNLDFSNFSYFNSDVTKFVDCVLQLCTSTQVKLFRLDLTYGVVLESFVLKWIDKAVCLNVREAHICLNNLVFPSSFFTCKTLINLNLNLNLRSERWGFNNWKLPDSVHLPCLKTLGIAAYTIPFLDVIKLINGSPILESLSLRVEQSEDEDYIFNLPTLKQLKLTFESPPNVINKVVLNVPNLEYLLVGGYLSSRYIFEDVSSLVEASVSFRNKTDDRVWVELLKGVRGVKSFSAHEPCVSFASSAYPVFSNMEHMELKGSWDSGKIFHFLESSPHLKHLCIERKYIRYFQIAGSRWTNLVPDCMLKSLTTIKFSKCMGQKQDIELIAYMLGNAEVLKLVKIIPEDLCIEEEMQFYAQLLKLSKASQFCEIRFLGKKISSIDGKVPYVKFFNY